MGLLGVICTMIIIYVIAFTLGFYTVREGEVGLIK
jgi:hypothetical protein